MAGKGFPGVLVVKNLPANAEDARDTGLIPGWEGPLEEEMVTSILAWEITWTEEPGGLYIVHGVKKELDMTEST